MLTLAHKRPSAAACACPAKADPSALPAAWRALADVFGFPTAEDARAFERTARAAAKACPRWEDLLPVLEEVDRRVLDDAATPAERAALHRAWDAHFDEHGVAVFSAGDVPCVAVAPGQRRGLDALLARERALRARLPPGEDGRHLLAVLRERFGWAGAC